MKNLKYLSILIISLVFFGVDHQSFVKAQSTSYWSTCSNGTTIARCETYNCPNGDSNKDGRCTKDDKNASLIEARNDAFCANPQSGCGEVLYYSSNTTNACAVRVKENSETSCDLYRASNPGFTSSPNPTASPTPRPSITPSPAPVQTATTSPKSTATPTSVPSSGELPKTGPEIWVAIIVSAGLMYGLYVYEKNKEPDTK